MVRREPLMLDYRGAETGGKDLRYSLSGAAVAGDYLWTASDEGRSVECLKPDGNGGYRLRKQYHLDKKFKVVPGKPFNAKKPDEVDIESLCVADGALWICASHCRVRPKPDDENKLARPNWDFETPRSRHFLGRVPLTPDGRAPAKLGRALPSKGPRSLRSRLSENPFLKPFVDLPSKENGLDIEGMTKQDGRRLLLGLRGPLVSEIAIVLEMELAEVMHLTKERPIMHFLKLDGLAVRDLAPSGDDVLVLAGPVASKDGPFNLYRWTPNVQRDVQSTELLHTWPVSHDHPEAICPLKHDGEEGLLVLYDNPQEARIGEGTHTAYTADWLSMR